MTNPFAQRMPSRPSGPSRRQILFAVILILIFVLLGSARAVARLYTDYLWFHEVHFGAVWSGVIATKVFLVAVFGIAGFLIFGVNLAIARRLAPKATFLSPQEEAIRRFREIMRVRGNRINIAASVIVGLLLGYPAYQQWQGWLMFRHAATFAVRDSQFSRDVGFYVFRLPFISFMVGWVFSALLFTTVVVVVLHYMYGGIQVQNRANRVTAGLRGHLSVLLGLLALTKSVDYYLQRYELTFSRRGFVSGAGYTDVHAVLPALNFLMLVAAFAAVLFFANIAVRKWSLPIIAVGLWLVLEIVLAGIYPAFVQKFRVQPSESTKELPYISRNINATRQAFGITPDDPAHPSSPSQVDVKTFTFANDLTSNDLSSYQGTLNNVRLWDPANAVAGNAFQRLQGVRNFYNFSDTDVDRYTINGKTTPVLISARELDPTQLPSKSWENTQVAYTHGFGAIVSPYGASTPEGNPQFSVKDIPVVSDPGAPTITQPRIYFGDNQTGYVVTKSNRQEIDYVDSAGNTQNSTYTGNGGVPANSLLRRAAFALRFGDVNPLISSLVNSHSRFIYNRDIRLRVHTVAPFLQLDNDPYPVIIGGRIEWVLDGYTTTNRYPYASDADRSNLSSGSDLGNTAFNYVRNSVKITVDAQDGTTKLYIVDKTDPIIETWRSAFPSLFTDGAKMPDELRAHLRYPEDMFRVQSTMWSSYHITNPKDFYGKSDLWNISQDPASASGSGVAERRMVPYYVYMQVPGEANPSFVLMQSFVPASTNDTRREMVSFMIAKMDGSQYGKLLSFELPRENLPPGPADIAQRIQSNPDISKQQSLLNSGQSQALQGNLLVIPIKDSFIYVQPWYVESKSTADGSVPLPQLKYVAVVYGDKISFQPTFQQALTDVFGANAPQLSNNQQSSSTVVTTPGAPASTSVSDLLSRAQDDFNAAQAALKTGDLGTYKQKNDDGQALVQQAIGLLGSTTTTSVTVAK